MSFLENPTVKRVLMIVVALAVVAAVAYVIYHFTAGPGAPHHGSATTTQHMDATTTQPETTPMFTGIDTHIMGGTVGHQPGMSSEGFAQGAHEALILNHQLNNAKALQDAQPAKMFKKALKTLALPKMVKNLLLNL